MNDTDPVRSEPEELSTPAPAGPAPAAGPGGSGSEPTGHPRVDAALAELDRVAELPPAEQVAGFAGIQSELQSTLASLDEER
jgi:hypothetical protein